MTTFNVNPFQRFDYIKEEKPSFDTNPSVPYVSWLNITTGEEFICHDNTADANLWKGSLGSQQTGKVIFHDTFTASDGTTLENRIPDIGNTWGTKTSTLNTIYGEIYSNRLQIRGAATSVGYWRSYFDAEYENPKSFDFEWEWQQNDGWGNGGISLNIFGFAFAGGDTAPVDHVTVTIPGSAAQQIGVGETLSDSTFYTGFRARWDGINLYYYFKGNIIAIFPYSGSPTGDNLFLQGTGSTSEPWRTRFDNIKLTFNGDAP